MPPAKPTLDQAQVRHVAKLASLNLSDDEAARLAHDLQSIVAHVEELATLNTDGVEPTASVLLERSAWRADEVTPGVSHDEALAQAPRQDHGGFAVPAFVE